MYALVPAAVPARRGARRDVTSVWAMPVYRRARYDYWAVAVTAAVAVVLVGQIAACDGDRDYGEYDCRYQPFHLSLLSSQRYCCLRLYLYKATNATNVTAFSRLPALGVAGIGKISMDCGR